MQLATRLAKVESELRGTQASLSTAEQEVQTLRQQLRVSGEAAAQMVACLTYGLG